MVGGLAITLLLWLVTVSGGLAQQTSHHGAVRRHLHQATAISGANAIAGPGQTSTATSNAGAVSTGSPTTAVSQAVAQNATVTCDVFAMNEAKYKACLNTPEGGPRTTYIEQNSGANAFAAAPICTQAGPTPQNSVADAQGRYWGFENGVSCAYKLPTGVPLTLVSAAPPTGAAAPPAAGPQWATAPICNTTQPLSNSVQDTQGHYWGFEGGVSCAYRFVNGTAKLPVLLPGASPSVPTTANATAQAAAAATGRR